MDNVARKGQSVGGTIPLGYRTVNKRLEFDPKAAPLVKRIFEMYTPYTDSPRAELEQVETATRNLIRAMEAGIFNTATKSRMGELEQQKKDLETALADAELISGLRLTKEHIKYFLMQFRNIDLGEKDSKRRLIDIFINAIFVYDDKLTMSNDGAGASPLPNKRSGRLSPSTP